MRILTLIFTCLLTFTLGAEQLRLADRLRQADAGEYLVTQQDRTVTLLMVRQIEGDRLVLEEITAPATRQRRDWPEWVLCGAPDHSSWVIYSIDLNSGQQRALYSYSRRGWLDIQQTDSFISTLVALHFQSIPDSDRRRVGPPPMGGPDRRRIWQPPLQYEGERQPGATFVAWQAEWPRDGSEMAGRSVTLYLPQTKGPHPTYFPYWIEVSALGRDRRLRAIDSGTGLVSPQPMLPSLLR